MKFAALALQPSKISSLGYEHQWEYWDSKLY